LYAVADLLAGLYWDDYSFRDQTISELGAIGAPSRPLFAAILIPVYLLMIGFGAGVWRTAFGRLKIKVIGALLIALGVLALAVGQFVPMQARGTEQGLTGLLHLVEGMVAMFILLIAMSIAAFSFGWRFRYYTITTIVLVFAFGAWSGMDAPLLNSGLITPWLGVKERLFWYTYQLWFIVLALKLLQQRGEN